MGVTFFARDPLGADSDECQKNEIYFLIVSINIGRIFAKWCHCLRPTGKIYFIIPQAFSRHFLWYFQWNHTKIIFSMESYKSHIFCRILQKSFFQWNHTKIILTSSDSAHFREQEVTGSIPGRDIPKSLKMVLAAPHLALRLKGLS